ncbi:unnamed protein product [Oppiella nova]|uniref:Uncharacterized protein n=1 Tax=Oppiella nova TaxID=334625 RepID=A0A7R9LNM4_9ACAR|nr:unnamed protein product [Oppiella nova]CAG2165436.1 unnamed protein product [Oppiella nova]
MGSMSNGLSKILLLGLTVSVVSLLCSEILKDMSLESVGLKYMGGLAINDLESPLNIFSGIQRLISKVRANTQPIFINVFSNAIDLESLLNIFSSIQRLISKTFKESTEPMDSSVGLGLNANTFSSLVIAKEGLKDISLESVRLKYMGGLAINVVSEMCSEMANGLVSMGVSRLTLEISTELSNSNESSSIGFSKIFASFKTSKESTEPMDSSVSLGLNANTFSSLYIDRVTFADNSSLLSLTLKDLSLIFNVLTALLGDVSEDFRSLWFQSEPFEWICINTSLSGSFHEFVVLVAISAAVSTLLYVWILRQYLRAPPLPRLLKGGAAANVAKQAVPSDTIAKSTHKEVSKPQPKSQPKPQTHETTKAKENLNEENNNEMPVKRRFSTEKSPISGQTPDNDVLIQIHSNGSLWNQRDRKSSDTSPNSAVKTLNIKDKSLSISESSDELSAKVTENTDKQNDTNSKDTNLNISEESQLIDRHTESKDTENIDENQLKGISDLVEEPIDTADKPLSIYSDEKVLAFSPKLTEESIGSVDSLDVLNEAKILEKPMEEDSLEFDNSVDTSNVNRDTPVVIDNTNEKSLSVSEINDKSEPKVSPNTDSVNTFKEYKTDCIVESIDSNRLSISSDFTDESLNTTKDIEKTLKDNDICVDNNVQIKSKDNTESDSFTIPKDNDFYYPLTDKPIDTKPLGISEHISDTPLIASPPMYFNPNDSSDMSFRPSEQSNENQLKGSFDLVDQPIDTANKPLSLTSDEKVLAFNPKPIEESLGSVDVLNKAKIIEKSMEENSLEFDNSVDTSNISRDTSVVIDNTNEKSEINDKSEPKVSPNTDSVDKVTESKTDCIAERIDKNRLSIGSDFTDESLNTTKDIEKTLKDNDICVDKEVHIKSKDNTESDVSKPIDEKPFVFSSQTMNTH